MPAARRTFESSSKRPLRSTKVSLPSELVRQARALGVNVSLAAESGVISALARLQQERWLADVHEALEPSEQRAVEKENPQPGRDES